jgi:hypothetical protein
MRRPAYRWRCRHCPQRGSALQIVVTMEQKLCCCILASVSHLHFKGNDYEQHCLARWSRRHRTCYLGLLRAAVKLTPAFRSCNNVQHNGASGPSSGRMDDWDRAKCATPSPIKGDQLPETSLESSPIIRQPPSLLEVVLAAISSRLPA